MSSLRRSQHGVESSFQKTAQEELHPTPRTTKEDTASLSPAQEKALKEIREIDKFVNERILRGFLTKIL